MNRRHFKNPRWGVLLLAAMLLAMCLAMSGCYNTTYIGEFEPGHVHTFVIGDRFGNPQTECGVAVSYLYYHLPSSFSKNEDPYNDNEIVALSDEEKDGVYCGQTYPEYEKYHCTGCQTEVWRPNGKTRVMDHDWDDWKVNAIPATCTEPSKDVRTCKRSVTCDAKEYRSVGKPLGHNYKLTGVVPATCTVPGNTGKKKCERCGHVHYGEVIPALGHDWGAATYAWSEDLSTCTATHVCTHDASHVESETVNAAVTNKGVPCTSDYTAVYTAVFTKPGFQTQTASAPLMPEPHTPEAIPDVPATCVKEGQAGGTRCAVCQTVLEPPTATDKNPNNHAGPFVVELNADVPATCSTNGYHTEGVCTACGAEVKTELPPDPNNHDWGAASYEWSADYTTCTAKRTCKHDGNHVETKTVDVTAVNTATCEAAGKITYTAAFDAPFETQTKSVDAPALGHTGGTATCTEPAVCTRCGEHYGDVNRDNHGDAGETKKYYRVEGDNGVEFYFNYYCNKCKALLRTEKGSEADTVDVELEPDQEPEQDKEEIIDPGNE